MKILCLLLVAICLSSPFSFAQSTSEAEQVKAAVEQLRQAILHKDKAALDRIYADEFVSLRSNGDLENKQARVTRAITAGVTELSFSNVEVRVNGTTAVVTLETSSVSEKGEHTHGRFVQTWSKVGGNWREVAIGGANLSPAEDSK